MEPYDVLTPTQRIRLWLRMGIRLLLLLGAIWFVKTLLAPLISLFLPFLLALLTAWLLNPVVRFFQKKLKLSRPLGSLFSVLLSFGLVGGAITVVCYFAVQELMQRARASSMSTKSSAARSVRPAPRSKEVCRYD